MKNSFFTYPKTPFPEKLILGSAKRTESPKKTKRYASFLPDLPTFKKNWGDFREEIKKLQNALTELTSKKNKNENDLCEIAKLQNRLKICEREQNKKSDSYRLLGDNNIKKTQQDLINLMNQSLKKN